MKRRNLLWMMAGLLLSCTPPAPNQPPPLLPTPQISEEEIRPPRMLQLAILNLDEQPSGDRRSVTLTGTILNRGERATRQVYVHVDALNRDGAIVLSSDLPPSTERIAPGGTGSFSATFDNRPEIDHYHVEAVAR